MHAVKVWAVGWMSLPRCLVSIKQGMAYSSLPHRSSGVGNGAEALVWLRRCPLCRGLLLAPRGRADCELLVLLGQTSAVTGPKQPGPSFQSTAKHTLVLPDAVKAKGEETSVALNFREPNPQCVEVTRVTQTGSSSLSDSSSNHRSRTLSR